MFKGGEYMKCSVYDCREIVVTKYPQHQCPLCAKHKQKFDERKLKIVYSRGINKIFKEY